VPQKIIKIDRLLCWFSCGATSAVAIKLAVAEFKNRLPITIAYCDTGSEHEDNKRFISDCEKWYGQKIQIFKSDKYSDIWDVFDKTKYLVGNRGARCTTELKKMVRHRVENPINDLQVFGFDAGEIPRLNRFIQNNPEVNIHTPLIDRNINKESCLKILVDAGIEIPQMYKLGFKNNNCIGCVKGGIGYWNKIRKAFPDVFQRMIDVEERLNTAILKYRGSYTFLKDIPPDAGKKEPEFVIKCGLVCGE